MARADRFHPSHITRMSFDVSSYDEICINCGATDTIGSWGDLAKPCPRPYTSNNTSGLDRPKDTTNASK